MSRFLYAWAPDEGDDAGKVAVDDERGVIEFLTPVQAEDLADSLKRAARYARQVQEAQLAEHYNRTGDLSEFTEETEPVTVRRPADSTPGSGDSSAGGTNSTR